MATEEFCFCKNKVGIPKLEEKPDPAYLGRQSQYT